MTEHLTDVDMASDAELLKLIRALGPVGEKAAQWIETLGGAYDKAFQQALENGQAAQEANALLNSEWFARVTYKQQLREALDKLADPGKREPPHCSTCECGVSAATLDAKIGALLIGRGFYDRMKDQTDEDTAARIVFEFLAEARPIVSAHYGRVSVTTGEGQ